MAWTAAHRELRTEFDQRLENNKARLGAKRVSELLEKHRNGDLNDDFSLGPGVTIYFKDFKPEEHGTTPEQLSEVAAERGRPVLLETLSPVPDMSSGCYELKLPEGGYFGGVGGFDVYESIGPEAERNDTHAFTTGYAFVLRMEGRLGELWQNVNYYPSGVPVRDGA